MATITATGVVTGNAVGYSDITYTINSGSCFSSATFRVFVGVVDVFSVANPTPTCYQNLGAAFNAINTGVYVGTITVRIHGDTEELSTAVLYASGANASGTSAFGSVIVYPAAVVNVTGNLNLPMIQLDGADNVTFYGGIGGIATTLDLTLTNTNTGTNASTIQFLNSSTLNRIRYCIIKGSTTSTNNGVIHFSGSGGGPTATGNDGNIIEYNDLTSSSSGRPTNVISSAGSGDRNNSENIIRFNNFYNIFHPSISSNGINLRALTVNWEISDNSFYENIGQINTGNRTYTAIRVDNIGGRNTYTFNILRNMIGGNSHNAAGVWNKTGGNSIFNGIYFNISDSLPAGTTISLIQLNTIRGFNWVNSGAANWTGIHLQKGIATIGGNPLQGNTIGSSIGTSSIVISNGATSALEIDGIFGIRAFNNLGTTVILIANNTVASIRTGSAANVGHFFNGIYTGRSSTNQTDLGAFNILENKIGNSTDHSIGIGMAGSNAPLVRNVAYGIHNTAEGSIDFTSNIIQHVSCFGIGSDPGWAQAEVYGIQFEGTNGGGNVIARNFV